MDATSGKNRWNQIVNALAICAIALLCLIFILPTASANAEKRSLKLYFLHTGERAEITFKRNGKYIQNGLTKINKLLRDWRRNEPTKMDPRLLDLIWEVYEETGSKKYIHVISAYRSPATNSLLRKRGRGVAKKSQHTLGKALDFFIPGVSLRKLRNIGLRKGTGGVGYYPKSGSPFVHMDTGSVRHWPRMSRGELVKVFPKGKTLHVPTDGKPLARYNQAKAEYERKTRGSAKIQIATAEEIVKQPDRFKRRFGRGDDDSESFRGVIAAVPKKVRTSIAPAPLPASSVSSGPAPAQTTTPVQEEPVFELAALPGSDAPIPTASPRSTSQLASTATPEILSTETEPESDPVQIASIVPVKRPLATDQNTDTGIEDEIADPGIDTETTGPSGQPNPVVEDGPAIVQEAPVEIAAVEPDQSLQTQPALTRPAAKDIFSANEIQDLRKQVYATLGDDNQNTTRSAPVPSAGIGNEAPEPSNSQIASSDFNENRLSLVPESPGQQQVAQQVVASILTEPEPLEPGIASTDITPVPKVREVKTPSERLEIAALTSDTVENSVEPAIIIPSRNPQRSADPASLVEENPIEIAGIAIPSRAERQLANTPQAETQKTDIAALQAPTRTNTLEQFETVNLEERIVGKWALAADTSISRIAEINPPAYGLNALRELPNTVLSSGFSRKNVRKIEDGFTGSSLEFLDFTRFN